MPPKTDALQGSLDLLVLKTLSRRSRLHGYAIMSAIQDISAEVLRVEEGSLYPAKTACDENFGPCNIVTVSTRQSGSGTIRACRNSSKQVPRMNKESGVLGSV